MQATVVLLLVLPCVLSAFAPGTRFTTKKEGNNWSVVRGTGGAADGYWEETRFKTGWDALYITSNQAYSAEDQAYAIGFLEGALQQPLTWDAWRSWVRDFLAENDKWVREQVRAHSSDAYWIQVKYVLLQAEGLLAGYNQYAPADQKLGYIDWLSFQAQPEMSDIYAAVGVPDELESTLPNYFGTHCSGLVKLTNNELFASHATWSSFTTMLRVFKFFTTPFAPVKSMQYSAYPGAIPSSDDYYTTSSQLMIMETTNEILDNSLYQYVTTETVPYWIRVTVATRMASSGSGWIDNFSLWNSGTYNNQWMVVDYKLYVPGKPLRPNTLWVMEQIPGHVEKADMTSTLNSTGYWASYNIPYFPYIYKVSGYPAYYEKYGNIYSYEDCSRAKIFRRDHNNVKDLDTMKHIMRYNEYQTDPLSLHDACKSISARCDLNSPWEPNTLNNWSPFGAIDAKITDSEMILSEKTVAVSGPTWQSQPVFAWTDEWKYYPSFGQPRVFAFDWVDMAPK